MCDPDMDTHYELYDRVVSVRLGTGVPVGTRGTIIGVMLGQTHLDTYYEVLFDHLPKNSLDAILLVGSNQQCRIKVRSYHLLNYSHSLRTRSMANYQQQQQQPQRAGPPENVWERRSGDQAPTNRQAPAQQQQPTRILKRGTTENTSATKAKPDAVPSTATTQEKPKLVDIILASAKEQTPKTKSTALASAEKVALPQALTESALLSQSQKPTVVSQAAVEKAPEPEKVSPAPQRHLPAAHEIPVPQPANPTFTSIESLLSRAIQDSKQIQNPEPYSLLSQAAAAQQPWNNNTGSPSLMLSRAMETSPFNQESWGNLSRQTMPSQSSSGDPFLTNPHTWDPTPKAQPQPGRTYPTLCLISFYFDDSRQDQGGEKHENHALIVFVEKELVEDNLRFLVNRQMRRASNRA